MRVTEEYKGIEISIPHNDDGVWHYQVHPKRDKQLTMRGTPQAAASGGYCTQQEAFEAGRRAIDAWLKRSSR